MSQNGHMQMLQNFQSVPDHFGTLCIKWLNYFRKRIFALLKKLSFPLKISSVNLTKSAVACGFGHFLCSMNGQ